MVELPLIALALARTEEKKKEAARKAYVKPESTKGSGAWCGAYQVYVAVGKLRGTNTRQRCGAAAAKLRGCCKRTR